MHTTTIILKTFGSRVRVYAELFKQISKPLHDNACISTKECTEYFSFNRLYLSYSVWMSICLSVCVCVCVCVYVFCASVSDTKENEKVEGDIRIGTTGERVLILRKPDLEQLRTDLQGVFDRGIRSLAVSLMHSCMYVPAVLIPSRRRKKQS